MNFNARVEHLMGATGQLQLEYSRRQNDRDNLGVGDFDLPERAYATDNSTDTFRVRSTNVIGKKVFSEFRFSLIDSTLSTTSASTLPTVRVNDAFNAGGAGQMGDRHAREIELAQNFDFTIGRKHSMRAGLLFEAGWWDSDQRIERVRHLHLHEPRRVQRRTAGDLRDSHRRSAGRLLAGQGRLVHPGRLPSGAGRCSSASACARRSRRRSIRSGTSRRAPRSPGTRPRRPPCAAATASSTTGTTRRSTSRRFASTATTRST